MARRGQIALPQAQGGPSERSQGRPSRPSSFDTLRTLRAGFGPPPSIPGAILPAVAQAVIPRIPRPPQAVVQQPPPQPPYQYQPEQPNRILAGLDRLSEMFGNKRVAPAIEEAIEPGLENVRELTAETLNRIGRWATEAHERVYAPNYEEYLPPVAGATPVGAKHPAGILSQQQGQVTSIVDIQPDEKKGIFSGTDYVVVRPDGQAEFAPRTRVTQPTVLRRAGRLAQEGLMGLLQGTFGVAAEAVERTVIGPMGRQAQMPTTPIELPVRLPTGQGGTVTYQPPTQANAPLTPLPEAAQSFQTETLEQAALRTFGNTPEVAEALETTDRIAFTGPEARLRAVARLLNGEDVEDVLYGNGGYVMDTLMDLGFADDPLRAIQSDPQTNYYYTRRKAEGAEDDEIVQEVATQGLPGEANPWAEALGQTVFDPTNFIGLGLMDEAVEATRVANTKKWFSGSMELDTAISLARKEYEPALKLGSRTLPLDWMPHVRTPSAALARTATLAADGMNATTMVFAENAIKLTPEARQAHILTQLQAYVDLAAPAPRLADFRGAAEAAEEIATQLLKVTPEQQLAEAAAKWESKRRLAETVLGDVPVSRSGAGQLGSAVLRQLVTDPATGKISKKLTEAITSGESTGKVLSEVMNGLNDATLQLLQPARRGAKTIEQFVELGGKAQDFPIFERGLAGAVERWTVHKAAAEAGLKYDVSPVTRAIAGSNFLRKHVDNALWTTFARMSPAYTVRNALNNITTAIVDNKLSMVAGKDIDAFELLLGSPSAANRGIGQGIQVGVGQEGFWKGGFAGEFKVGGVPIGAQAVERAFSRNIWYTGAKQFLDRQMTLGKAIPNLPAGVRLKMGEDAARQFTQMVARNYGNPAEAMEWLGKRLGGEAELWRVLDDEDFKLLQQHDPALAKRLQTLAHKAATPDDFRRGMSGLRGQTATKLNQIDESIPAIIDPDDPQWVGIAEDAKLADASGVEVPVDDFNKRVSKQREYVDAARGNALDALKSKQGASAEDVSRFVDTEKRVSGVAVDTRKAHDALRDKVKRDDALIHSTVRNPAQRQILLDNLWGNYFAERDELWTTFRHNATDEWDKMRAAMTGTEWQPRVYADTPRPKTVSPTDPYTPTSNPTLNSKILRDYARSFEEFPIYTATKIGAPNDKQLLNALNFKDYRLAAGLEEAAPFTVQELRAGLSPERLEEAESILSTRWTIKLAGGQLPPALLEQQAAEAAFRASPEAAQAQLSAVRQAQEAGNVLVKDLRRLFNPDGTAKAWEANNPGKWLEQAEELFRGTGGVDIPEDAGREFFEGLAQSQLRNVAAERTGRGVAGPAPRMKQDRLGEVPPRQGPPIPRLGEEVRGVHGELPLAAQGPDVPRLGEAVSVPKVPTVGNVQLGLPNVHLPPNDQHSLLPVLQRVESKVLSKWGQTAPISLGQSDWALMQAWAEQAGRQGQEARIIAGQVGSQARDFALLNYADRRNIDQWLSVVYPYHYWYTRTMGNWAKRLAMNPGAMATYGRYREALDQMHAALPDYWKQQLSTEDLGIPLDNPLMFNLEQTMSPLYGLMGEDYSDEKRRRAQLAGIDNAGGLVEDLGQFGPSLWAPITWALVASNARSDPEAAMAWGNNYLGGGFRALRGATALAGEAGVPGIPAGGLNLDPQMILTNMAVGNGASTQNMTQWERNSLAMQFQQLYSSPPPPGVNPQDWKAQVMQAGYTESGPLFDQMLQSLMVKTSPAVLTSFGLGLGFKGRGQEQVEIANIWAELASIRSHYDDWSPEEIALAYNDLEQRHPGYDTLVLLRASGAERDDQWTWEAISRVGIGYSDAWKAAGVSQAAWDEFYKLKTTAAMSPALRDELLMGVNAVNSIARVTTVEEARRQIEARNTYKQIEAQLQGEFEADTFALQDEYYQVRDTQGPDAADEFLAQLPPDSPLYELWDRRTELLAADPDASRYYLDPERYKSFLTSQWYDTQDPELVEAARLRKEYKDNGDFRAVDAVDARYPQLKQFYRERDAFYDALPGEVASWLDTLPEADQFQLREDIAPTTQLQKNLAGVKAKEEAMFNPLPEEQPTPGQGGLRQEIEAEVAAQLDIETKKNGYLTTDNRNVYETTLYEAVLREANDDPQMAQAMFEATHPGGWQVYGGLNSPDELIAYVGSASTGQLRESLLTDTTNEWTRALAYIRTLDPATIAQLKRSIPDIEVVAQHAQQWGYGPSEEARADIVGVKVAFNLDGSMTITRQKVNDYLGKTPAEETALDNLLAGMLGLPTTPVMSQSGYQPAPVQTQPGYQPTPESSPTGGPLDTSGAQATPTQTAPSGGGAMKWYDMAAQYGQANGVPPEFILALIQTESGGNQYAVGDGGHSVGLFQLYDKGGVGTGYTVEQRHDPKLQFDLMMPRIARAYQQGVAQGLAGVELATFVGGKAEGSQPQYHFRYGQSYQSILSKLAGGVPTQAAQPAPAPGPTPSTGAQPVTQVPGAPDYSALGELSSSDIQKALFRVGERKWPGIKQLWNTFVNTTTFQGYEAGQAFYEQYPELSEFDDFRDEVMQRFSEAKKGVKDSKKFKGGASGGGFDYGEAHPDPSDQSYWNWSGRERIDQENLPPELLQSPDGRFAVEDKKNGARYYFDNQYQARAFLAGLEGQIARVSPDVINAAIQYVNLRGDVGYEQSVGGKPGWMPDVPDLGSEAANAALLRLADAIDVLPGNHQPAFEIVTSYLNFMAKDADYLNDALADAPESIKAELQALGKALAKPDRKRKKEDFTTDRNKYYGGEGSLRRGKPRRGRGGGSGGRSRRGGGQQPAATGEGAYPAPADVGAWTSFVQAMGANPLMITRLSDYFDSDNFTRQAMLARYPELAALIARLGANLTNLEAAYFAWVEGRRPAAYGGGRRRTGGNLLRVYKKRSGKAGL